MKDTNGNIYLTAEAAASFLNVSPKTIMNWAKEGLIAKVVLGRRCVRYPLDSLLSFTEKRTIRAKGGEK